MVDQRVDLQLFQHVAAASGTATQQGHRWNLVVALGQGDITEDQHSQGDRLEMQGTHRRGGHCQEGIPQTPRKGCSLVFRCYARS